MENLNFDNLSENSIKDFSVTPFPHLNIFNKSMFNASANASGFDDEDAYVENIVSIVVPIFFGLIAILGFFGNLLVVIVVVLNPQMRSTTNLLILNLAMSDLLFVIFCIPFTAVDYMLATWPFGNFWCQVVQYLIIVTAFSSIYTLVLMSVDRFLAVCHPIRSISIRTERNSILALVILWIVIITITIPVFFSHGIHEYDYKSRTLKSCTFKENGTFNWASFHIAFFSTSYLLPLVIISGLYISMLLRLWRSSIAGQSHESKRGKKRVTRLVVIVVLAFATFWCPIQVILVLKSLGLFKPDSQLRIALQIGSHVLAYCSSCINPLLYAFLSENFRKAFRKVVYCNATSRKQNHHALPTKDITRTSNATRTGSL